MRPKANPVGNPRTSLAPAPVEPENIAPRLPVPPVPAHLGSEGTAVWHAVWAAGGEAYSPLTDAYVIERYATLHERRSELMKMLEEDGLTSVGSTGQTVLHPAARFLGDVEKALSSLEDKLGLNPESRIRLGIAAVEKESKLDAFLKQANAA
jgi:P27 family predicted phage terminase small subunit